MATFRNNRSGETVESNLSHADAYRIVAEEYGADPNHWLHFWVHRYAAGRTRHQAAANLIRKLGDMFLVAQGYGLKRPMIRVHFRGRRFKLYLSARGTLCLKTGHLAPLATVCGCGGGHGAGAVDCPLPRGGTYHPQNDRHGVECRGCTSDTSKHGLVAYSHDPVGDEEYAGCWSGSDWRVARERHRSRVTDRWVDGPPRMQDEDEREFLARLTADPTGFLAACSKDMSRCCYCYKQLDDERSKSAGYGPVCAKRWGLPWGTKDGQRVPSFSEVYNDAIASALQAIRESPKDERLWNGLGDLIGEFGLPRPTMPTGNVPVPRS